LVFSALDEPLLDQGKNNRDAFVPHKAFGKGKKVTTEEDFDAKPSHMVN
jgi:hypothetical protein